MPDFMRRNAEPPRDFFDDLVARLVELRLVWIDARVDPLRAALQHEKVEGLARPLVPVVDLVAEILNLRRRQTAIVLNDAAHLRPIVEELLAEAFGREPVREANATTSIPQRPSRPGP